MKELCAYLMAVLFVSCGFSYGQGLNVLLEDDFNDGIVDLAKWTAEEPFADSSVSETGGYVELQNRGRITSTIGIDDPYEVRGRFQLSNVERSNIKFVLRSDGVAVPRWSDSQGVAVQFQIRGDAANTNQIAIFNIDSSGTQTGSATLTTPLSLDQWYDFRIVDDGARISLFFNGDTTETLGFDTNWSAGNLISIYNREGAAGGSSISAGGIARVDSFSIQQLPSPTKYQVIEGNFTWQEAKADAKAKGGRLAVLDTQEKIDAADSYLQKYYGDDNFRVHIGLTDELVEGEYRWITGELLTASKWAGQEFLPTPGEDYISWYRTSFSQYGWFDHSNSAKEQYLLEILDETPPTAEFQIIEGNFTWDEAKADAETRGGRLAIIDTPEKNSTVMALGGNWSIAHIGLTDREVEGEWKWIDGTPLTWNDWRGGEPNDAGGEDVANIVKNRGWNDEYVERDGQFIRYPYILEILDQDPAVPFVAIDPLYESPSGESITLDATPTVGFPTEFTYQWCFNGFKIPANLGGTASSINIDNLQANEGTWSVIITNSEGIFEQDFEYRLYADSDSDGLSDGYEEVISKTDINNPDTDNDGLVDGDEVNTYRTNPNSTDSDSDGFTDLYELETAYDPNSAESVPDALVEIMTAIEVKFNAALGATYAIEFSTDNQAWDVIEDDIVGEGGAIERLYSKQEYPTGFFRVERKD
tara:strand:+ start:401 stop:2503 length:2103 start_codon:yes stop_codon:yes gene_type:complete